MALSLNLGRVRQRENAKGGGYLYLRQISPTPSDTFLDVGWLGGTDFDDKKTTIESKDECGDLVILLTSDRQATIKSVLHQVSQAEIDLINKSTNIFYDAIYKCLLADGTTQVVSLPVCQVAPGASLNYKPGQRSLALTIYGLAVKAAMTRTGTDYNVALREPYVMFTADVGAFALPSDTALSVAAACL